MRVVRHLGPGDRPFRRPVVALGNFDGVHLGHRTIFERTLARAAAAGSDAVAFTFWPHPIAVLFPERAPRMITSLARRLAALRSTGLDGVVVRRFTREFAALSPEDFVRDWLVGRLGVSAVVVGYNVTFGHERRGTPPRLAELGAEMGFEVEIVSPVEVGDLATSSSEVRRRIVEGDVAAAARLLGRPHSLIGLVRRGDRRGNTIGFPTANVHPRGGLLPPDGVYAVRVGLGGEEPRRPGVANLGSNPTFGTGVRRLETHLFDFDGDLYGRRIEVALEARLRGEAKFDSVDRLVAQIREDAAAARRILGVER
ncbi:bifunctional riboflavin kinase/FAD synthetase [bacterium]|nr:bifunctional riboflavin kinase/FAD synthetase [bacterium]